jgi:hypothetical protein
MFLSLATQIESQLRDAYARRHEAGEATQASIADKLEVNRSAIHHRLTGRTNMTIETIADMVWALGYAIRVHIYDPKAVGQNDSLGADLPTATPPPGLEVSRFPSQARPPCSTELAVS